MVFVVHLARAIFLDVDFDFLGNEVGVTVVIDFEHDVSLPFFEADDVEGPGSVFRVVLYLGDAFIADLPVERIAVVSIRGERFAVAVLGDEAHGEQGRFLAVPHFNFPLHLAILIAHDLLAAIADNQADSFGMVVCVVVVDGVVVVAAARGKKGKNKHTEGRDFPEHDLILQ